MSLVQTEFTRDPGQTVQHALELAGQNPHLLDKQGAHPDATRDGRDDHDSRDDKDEKLGSHDVEVEVTDALVPYVPGDPIPAEPDYVEEDHQMTVRSLFVGCCIGTVVQASNIYLGLKTGFTFGPQLLGGIGGFLVLKPLARATGSFLPGWVGGTRFGPKENVTCQTAATATGGLGILFVSGFPAMYQLGLLGASPKDDVGKLILFMLTVAFFGMAFAIPMRNYFVLRLKLTFPTPTATAFAIRALHAGKSGAEAAKQKGRWLFWSFLPAFVQKVASTYAPGILYDIHIFYDIATWGGRSAQYVDNWGWYFEITPAFFGAGILSGMNASWSFYGGSILAWAIIGPSMVATGRAIGRPVDDGSGIPYISYYSMAPTDPTSTRTSPRYNLLWIGVLVMLVSSFVELFCQWKLIYSGVRPMVFAARNKLRVRRGRPALVSNHDEPAYDPMPKSAMVPWWAWVGMLLVSIALTLIILGVSFGVNVGLSILAIVLGFLFSFIGVMGAGQTDVNPVSTVAKASQLVLGGVTHGKYTDEIQAGTGYNLHALRVNLLAGLHSAGTAAQTADMTGDLKTGHLVGAKPVNQFIAQGVGALISCFVSTGFFLLFTSAAPCIIDAEAETCAYGAPSVAAWRSVAVAVTSTDGVPVPITSGILAIVLSVVAAIMIVARQTIVPMKYRGYVPNPSAAGLAFVLPQTQYGLAMVIGATGAFFWQRKNPKHYEGAAFAFAAGMIAGEGIGGVVQAILQVAGVAGAGFGTVAGCPQGGC